MGGCRASSTHWDNAETMLAQCVGPMLAQCTSAKDLLPQKPDLN